jgi:hypothetical protein
VPVLPGREHANQVALALQHSHGGQSPLSVASHHVQHHMHGGGELAVQRVARHASQSGQRLQPRGNLGGRVRVQGAGTTLVAGVECGEQLAHLRPPYLPDHQAVRAHPQRLAHQVAQRHLAGALDVGLPGGQPDDMRVTRRQLGGLLDAHDPFACRHAAQQRGEQGGLATTCTSDDEKGQPGGDDGAQQPASLGRHAAHLL